MSRIALAPGDEEARIIELLTVERMASYLDATEGDPSVALLLYEWNIRATGALLGLAGMVEVIVRNAVDRELRTYAARCHGDDWLDDAPLDERARRDIQRAQRRFKGSDEKRSRNRTIAELSMGFWRYLTASQYHTAHWVLAICRAFPLGHRDLRRRRLDVSKSLGNVSFVRNRAAHHEPLHRRDLLTDVARAAEIVGWVDPTARIWLERNEMVSAAFVSHPSRYSRSDTPDRRADH